MAHPSVPNRKPIYKRRWFIVAAALVILFLGSLGDSENEERGSTEESIGNEAPAQAEAIDVMADASQGDWLRVFALEIMGDDLRAADVVENDLAVIEFDGTDNFTAGMRRGGMMMDAMDLMKELHAKPELDKVQAFEARAYFSLLDQYGNSSDEIVMRVRMPVSTLTKVNWENISSDMFESLARREGQMYWHQTMN